MVKSGIHEEDIAVITPYRQQIKLLSRLLSNTGRIEVMTADKSQGRDKECIIISMVRSNDMGNVSTVWACRPLECRSRRAYRNLLPTLQIGELLRDWRRINVSFTRARSKLIIIGSRHTLQSDRLLSDFFALMDEKGWVYKLKKGDEKRHEVLFPLPDDSGSIGSGDGRLGRGGKRNEAKEQDKRKGMGEGLIASRPFLRDALNDITNLGNRTS